MFVSLDVVPELTKRSPELHHVLGDGVEVLQRAVDVTRALLHVQGVVQDDLVTDGGYPSCVLLQVVIVLPLTVELVGIASVDFPELLLEVGGQVDGGVEVLPDEGVVLHVLDVVLLRHVARGQVADPVHRHDSDVLDGAEKILKRKG